MKIAQFVALCFICILGLPRTASAHPFVVSTDGTEVTDQKTNLIWRRCAEGYTYSGDICTISGTILFAHETALILAKTKADSSSIAWRLPNIKELSSIADIHNLRPAIDNSAFPFTPAACFWSSSPNVGYSNYAWSVNFDHGIVDDHKRSDNCYVRLVRGG